MNHLKTAFHAFQLKKLEIYLNLTFFLIVNTSYAQAFNKEAFLKDYSGDMIVTTQVRGERNKAVLRGTEAQKNSAFVLKNYNGIQPSVYPAWEGGFWPKKNLKQLMILKSTRQL